MEPWRTGIANTDETHVWLRGYDVTSLMTGATFTDTIFLLHQGRLPSQDERRLLDAILIGVCEHGPGAPSAAAARIVASGNRQSLEAAIAMEDRNQVLCSRSEEFSEGIRAFLEKRKPVYIRL